MIFGEMYINLLEGSVAIDLFDKFFARSETTEISCCCRNDMEKWLTQVHLAEDPIRILQWSD